MKRKNWWKETWSTWKAEPWFHVAVIFGCAAFAGGATDYIFNWPLVFGATWWEFMTSIGTVGAVIVSVFLFHYERLSVMAENKSKARDGIKKQLNISLRASIYITNTLRYYDVGNQEIKRPNFSEIEFLGVISRLDNAIYILKKSLTDDCLSEDVFFQILRIVDHGFCVREFFIADYKRRADFSDSELRKYFNEIIAEFQSIQNDLNGIIMALGFSVDSDA